MPLKPPGLFGIWAEEKSLDQYTGRPWGAFYRLIGLCGRPNRAPWGHDKLLVSKELGAQLIIGTIRGVKVVSLLLGDPAENPFGATNRRAGRTAGRRKGPSTG